MNFCKKEYVKDPPKMKSMLKQYCEDVKDRLLDNGITS
jgi:hypothetical protein